MAHPLQTLSQRLLHPTDIALLVLFRIGFGGIILWTVWRCFHPGWIEAFFVRPDFHFRYLGFGWLPALPDAGCPLLFLAALGLLLG